MSKALSALLAEGRLSPLSYHFARFVTQGSGVALDSLLGWSAALVSQCNLRGDVCVDLSCYIDRPLFGSEEESAEVPRGPQLQDWLAELKRCAWVGRPGHLAPLVLDGRRLYLGAYWRYEQQVAQSLLARLAPPFAAFDAAKLRQGLEQLFPSAPTLDWQRVAAALAVSRRFSVLSGGPGTGKTTTVVKVLALLRDQHPSLRIALAAPTGKAAARLTESIQQGRAALPPTLRDAVPTEASTLHRLLGKGFRPHYEHHRNNPLPLDCLVVDEASMVDLPLMAQLLEALPLEARLILLGDREQLASVEAGNVLGDITGHGAPIAYSPSQVKHLEALNAVPKDALKAKPEAPPCADAVALLRISYRFRPDSGIGALAAEINCGQAEEALARLQSESESLGWISAPPEGLEVSCIRWALDHYCHYLRQPDPVSALQAFGRYRVLTALRQGPLGAVAINQLLEARLRAEGWIEAGEEYPGKSIMILVNDYELGLFNGDIGLFWRDEQGQLRAYFQNVSGQVRSFSLRQLPPYETALALTVHKSQGSEFEAVLLVLPREPNALVTRELLYTAITRARREVRIQGGIACFLQGVKRRVHRTSALATHLGW